MILEKTQPGLPAGISTNIYHQRTLMAVLYTLLWDGCQTEMHPINLLIGILQIAGEVQVGRRQDLHTQ